MTRLIEVRCFDSLEGAAFLREDVNALNRLAARPDPFSTFEFLENHLRHDDKAPVGSVWFLTAFQGGCLIGYMPLKLETRRVMGIATPILTFLVGHDTDRPHVVALPEHQADVGAAFYAYVLGRKREWTLFELPQQDDASFCPPAATAGDGYQLRQWPSLANCTVHIRWGTLREYFGALSEKFRNNLARQMRNLFAAGDLQLLASSDPSVVPVLFDLYRSIEPRSWKSRADVGIGQDPERVEYFRGLLDARQPMRISILVLLLNGVPIAGLVNGAFMQGLYALHVVYDDRLQRLAPGSAILLLGMRQAIAGRYAFFNLLSGFGYFKTRWLAEVTETHVAQIYRARALPAWRRLLGDVKRAVFSDESLASRLLFNPSRRAVEQRSARNGTKPLESSSLEPTLETRDAVNAVIEAVRLGRGECMSAGDIAAAMPFATRRA